MIQRGCILELPYCRASQATRAYSVPVGKMVKRPSHLHVDEPATHALSVVCLCEVRETHLSHLPLQQNLMDAMGFYCIITGDTKWPKVIVVSKMCCLRPLYRSLPSPSFLSYQVPLCSL